ncbi:MAG: proteobacterial dedicated sortase system response regulator [Gammaproteobacteria bacterium]|nr:proteobacterial dedicated sortase system response regulator [Gammaproteobacteria bacterium]
MSRKIALIEDEPAIRKNYADALTKQGYQVLGLESRQEALQSFQTHLPDLAIIDISLGDDVEGGFDVCRMLRSKSNTLPIIFLTARDSDFDVISGLRLGADDYLTKDVSIHQILARVAALFRRIDALETELSEADLRKVGDLSIDSTSLNVEWKEQKVMLTITEFWILNSLVRIPGHVKNRDQLMQDANIFVDDGTVTSHVKRLRRKFETLDESFDCIETVYGMGYRWNKK